MKEEGREGVKEGGREGGNHTNSLQANPAVMFVVPTPVVCLHAFVLDNPATVTAAATTAATAAAAATTAATAVAAPTCTPPPPPPCR